MIDESECQFINKTEQYETSTPKLKQNKQLPGIGMASPKVAFKNPPPAEPDVQKSLKKLPEIKNHKPPIIRQTSSKQYLNLKPHPATPDLQGRVPKSEIVSRFKNVQDKNRFVTKESPDSVVGDSQTDQKGIDHLSKQEDSSGGSPKWCFDDKKPKRRIHAESELASYESKVPIVKYRMHAQPKTIEKLLKKQERRISDDLHSENEKEKDLLGFEPHQRELIQNKLKNHHPLKIMVLKSQQTQRSSISSDNGDYPEIIRATERQELQQISETPENKMVDQTTLSQFFNTEEQQQYQKLEGEGIEIIETAAFDFQPQFQNQKRKTIRNSNSNAERIKDQRNMYLKQTSNTDEEKNRKKAYKIIYKDPFQRPAVKPMLQGDEDMHLMCNELKMLLQTNEAKTSTQLDHAPIHVEDDQNSNSYSEDSEQDVPEKHSNGVPQAQINTWFSNKEPQIQQPKGLRETPSETGLQYQLRTKLGAQFDLMFQIAKASAHLPDIGQANLKMSLLEKIPGIEDHVAEQYATLLVTLVLQSKGQRFKHSI